MDHKGQKDTKQNLSLCYLHSLWTTFNAFSSSVSIWKNSGEFLWGWEVMHWMSDKSHTLMSWLKPDHSLNSLIRLRFSSPSEQGQKKKKGSQLYLRLTGQKAYTQMSCIMHAKGSLTTTTPCAAHLKCEFAVHASLCLTHPPQTHPHPNPHTSSAAGLMFSLEMIEKP